MKKSTIFGLIITAVWILGILYLVPVNDFFELDLNEKGDFLAGIVAPLAFFWFILAYFLQKEELKENTKALKGQEQQLLETKEQFKIQQFENSFFELLRMNRELYNSLKQEDYRMTSYKSSSDPDLTEKVFRDISGINESDDFFDKISKLINNKFDRSFRTQKNQISTVLNEGIQSINDELLKSEVLNFLKLFSKNESEIKKSISDFYDTLFFGYESKLGHYLRSLYHCIKFIADSDLDVKRKQKFADIIQSYLSDSELYLLMYNGIGIYGNKKFLPLIEKFRLLENVKNRGPIFEFHLSTFYPNNYNSWIEKPRRKEKSENRLIDIKNFIESSNLRDDSPPL